VEAYREQAGATGVQGDVRDLLAVQMMERDLALMPRSLTLTEAGGAPPSSGPGLLKSAGYVTALTAVLGGGAGHQLSPSLLSVLGGFEVKESLLFEQQPGILQLGPSPTVAEATEKLSQVALPSGLEVLGSWNEAECALADRAVGEMSRRIPASRDLVQKVVLQTFLAGGGDQSVGGRYTFDRPGEVHLARFKLAERGERVLWHEAGHALDDKLGEISSSPGSPFGKGPGAWAFVSEYAMTSPREDFAETHEDLVANWDQYLTYPEIAFYGEGPKADKRRFILEKCYGMELPPVREFWPRIQAAAQEGPFGWETPDGRRVGVEGDFERSVAQLHQGSAHPWLSAVLAGQTPPASSVKSVSEVQALVSEAVRDSGNLLMLAFLQRPEVARADAQEAARLLGTAEPAEGGELLGRDEQMTLALACYRAGGDNQKFATLIETLGVGGDALKAELRTPQDGPFERWLLGST